MCGMRAVMRIVMPAGACERILTVPGAGVSLVNVKPKHIGSARLRSGWKAVDLRNENHSVYGLVKRDGAVYAGVVRTAGQDGAGIGNSP